MLFVALTYVLSILSIIVVALFVLLRNNQLAFKLFGILSLTIAIFSLTQFLTDAHIGDGALWLRIAALLGSFLATIFVAFMYSFPNHNTIPRKLLIPAILPIIIFGPLSFTGLIVADVSLVGGETEFTPGPVYNLHTAVIVAYILFGVFLLCRQLVHATGRLRAQVYLLILAFIIVLAGNFISGFVFPNNEYWQAARPLSVLGMVVTITVAMASYKLFDIRLLLARVVAYLVALVTVATLYGFVVFGSAQLLFDLAIPIYVQVLLSIITGISALIFTKFKSSFDKVTNRIFYQDAYDPQVLFDEYNKALVSTIDLDVLLKRTIKVIAHHIKTEFCLVGVKDGNENEYRTVGTHRIDFEQSDIRLIRKSASNIHRSVVVVEDLAVDAGKLPIALRKYNISLLIRLTTDFHHSGEGLGYMVLGPKKSGNPYTSQDIKVLETLANELIIALQNALRFEEIERFNETLQQKVEDATQKLRVSNKKLKELNDSKDDFIGMASHQLRTPLTSIKGYVSLVMDGDVGKINNQQYELLRQASVSAQRMVYLIADLLNISRLKTGKFNIERSPTNLSKLISDELAQLKETAATRNVSLDFQPPAHFPTLPLDETKTRQVIMNFIDNAIYYTPAGGHIKVELSESEKSVELRVVDDGIGVPAADQHQLWAKFYRAKNAQRARPDGTGLGLYMARKVITAQGGATIFESKEGEGSTFGFMFPKDLPTESGIVVTNAT